MSDNHYTYIHMTQMQRQMLNADDDPCIHEPLPDEGEPGLVIDLLLRWSDSCSVLIYVPYSLPYRTRPH